MILSLWMLRNCFSGQIREFRCENTEPGITDFRLYTSDSDMDQSTMYIGHASEMLHLDSPLVALANRGDYLLLESEDLVAAANTVLGVFRYYLDWEERCRTAVHSTADLPSLLNLGEEALGAQLLIVDSSQYVFSYSAGILNYSGDEVFSGIINRKHLEESRLKSFNQAYSHTFTSKDSFFIPKGFFPTACLCHHIFLNRIRSATLIMLCESDQPPLETRHCFEQFLPFVQEWIQLNLSADTASHLAENFARLLDGNKDALPTVERGLSLRGWKKNCTMELIAGISVSEPFHFDAFLVHTLAQKNTWLYAIPFQKKIIILCNLDLISEDDLHSFLRDNMQTQRYCGAASTRFRDLSKVSEALSQAVAVLESIQRTPGELSLFQNHAMRYINSIVKASCSLPVVHPIPDTLRAYDKEHQTQFYDTLFCYLRNERNHQRTSAELYIHRNTLSQRISKIRELWDLNLDDPEERLYLLYSFYY